MWPVATLRGCLGRPSPAAGRRLEVVSPARADEGVTAWRVVGLLVFLAGLGGLSPLPRARVAAPKLVGGAGHQHLHLPRRYDPPDASRSRSSRSRPPPSSPRPSPPTPATPSTPTARASSARATSKPRSAATTRPCRRPLTPRAWCSPPNSPPRNRWPQGRRPSRLAGRLAGRHPVRHPERPTVRHAGPVAGSDLHVHQRQRQRQRQQDVSAWKCAFQDLGLHHGHPLGHSHSPGSIPPILRPPTRPDCTSQRQVQDQIAELRCAELAEALDELDRPDSFNTFSPGPLHHVDVIGDQDGALPGGGDGRRASRALLILPGWSGWATRSRSYRAASSSENG